MGITPFRAIPPLSARDEHRFWSKVSKTDTCWIWTGTTRPSTSQMLPYGFFGVTFEAPPYGRVTALFNAHRIAYALAKGPIPQGMQILHSCDNARCVNPDHLRAGTFRENMADKIRRNRHPRGGRVPGITLPKSALPTRSGERSIWAKLTDSQVKEIRELYASKTELTMSDLARSYNVSKQNIAIILRGESRKTASGPISAIRPIVGSLVKGSKMTPENIRTIRSLYGAGQTTIFILAERFGLSPQTISKIVRRESWRHVI